VTTIRLTFPAGRYHATPWGRHVNEAVPEWPPSPYRLLRALYDVWQRKCSDIAAEAVQEVLEALATGTPQFHLPRATATHTRSYLSSNSTDPTDKNLVFDSFLAFERDGACHVSWADLELTPASHATLARLLTNLNYLGRSESWIEAELLENRFDKTANCYVATDTGTSGELISVACAVSPLEYAGRRSWMDALTFSTTNMLKERASAPPLLRLVPYKRQTDAIETDPPHRPHRLKPEIQAVTLGLDATVLPLVTTTLEVAEQIRVRLMGAHKRRMGGHESLVSPLFSGKSESGGKRLDHGHVYILPQGNRNGRIDRVRIVSPLRPFDEQEMDAVRGVRELWQSDGRPSVRCVLTWQGPTDGRVEARSAIVESATPFIPPRHWRKGRDFKEFLFEEVEYRRNRKNDPVRPGYALRLTFDREIASPFTIGYGAHFGLGQFRPSISVVD
jgi:CRISPR-associated protein Csb2